MSDTLQQGTDQAAVAQAAADADYDAVLTAVNVVAKANAGLDDDDATRAAAGAGDGAKDDEDEGDEDEGDEDEGDEDELAKAAATFMDASPLVGALVASHDRLAKGQRLVMRELRQLRRDQGVMAKANALLLGQNRQLREEVEALGSGGAGRRSVVQRPMGKAKPVVEGGNPNDALFGGALMAKATAAALAGDALTGIELSTINEYAGMGATLGNIRDVDPQLASRFDAAVAALPKS